MVTASLIIAYQEAVTMLIKFILTELNNTKFNTRDFGDIQTCLKDDPENHLE